MLQKGSIAPDFELFDTNLQRVKLSEIQGKVVLVFYPGAFTSVREKNFALSETC